MARFGEPQIQEPEFRSLGPKQTTVVQLRPSQRHSGNDFDPRAKVTSASCQAKSIKKPGPAQ